MLAQCLICSVGAHIKKCHVIKLSVFVIIVTEILAVNLFGLYVLCSQIFRPCDALKRIWLLFFFISFAHIDVCMIWINDEIGLKQLSGVTSCDLKR